MVERGSRWYLQALRHENGNAIVDDQVRSSPCRVARGFSSCLPAKRLQSQSQFRGQGLEVTKRSGKQSVAVLGQVDRVATDGLPSRYYGKRHCWRCERTRRIEENMGYRERQVDRCRKEGSLRPGVVEDIVNRMVCEREGDAGLGNPWWT